MKTLVMFSGCGHLLTYKAHGGIDEAHVCPTCLDLPRGGPGWGVEPAPKIRWDWKNAI